MSRAWLIGLLLAGPGFGCLNEAVDGASPSDAQIADVGPATDMTVDSARADGGPPPADGAPTRDVDPPDAAHSTVDASPTSDAETPPDGALTPDAAPPTDAARPIDAAPRPPDAAADPCADLLACQGFEGLAPGTQDIPGWAIVAPNCSGEGRIAIEDDRPHTGARLMHVTGPGGYCNHVFLALDAPLALAGAPLHVRFYMRVARPLGFGHITFLAMHDAQTERDLRMGGQSEILMWNREIDDATLPELSPTGIDLSFAPEPNRWHCVEFMVDGPAGGLQTWVDGALVEGLVVDAEPTPDVDRQWHRRDDWHPRLQDLRLGWESYGGDPADVYFDDIAVATHPIGCLP